MINTYLYTVLILYNTVGYFCTEQGFLKELNQNVLDDYSNSNFTAECPTDHNDTLIIKGYNVKFSDFVGSDGKLYELCSNRSAIKTLRVYVLNSLFIDMDLNGVGDEMQLIVIAPNWKVSGKRRIDLSGSDGKAHDPSTAKSGVRGSKNGANGLPGNPGGPGGSYLGIGESFVDGKNLYVSASGGNGGLGQNGGNGMDFIIRYPSLCNFIAEGEKCISIIFVCFPAILITDEHYPNSEHQTEIMWDNHNEQSTFICEKHFSSTGINRKVTFQQDLNPKDFAGLPGNGGSGGKGGLPGKPWNIELSQFSFISHFNDSGGSGSGGKGGLGGKPGGPAKLLTWTCTNSVTYQNYTDLPYFGHAKSQTKGSDGSFTTGIKNPKKPKELNPSEEINKYKSFLRESLSNDPVRVKSLVQFYMLMDSNEIVLSVYNTDGLVAELRSIEDHFHLLSRDVDFTPFYTSLLNRIAAYVDSKDSTLGTKHFEEERKVLAYAYSAILGKLFFLKESSKSVLVTDIGSYLHLTKNRFDELNHLAEQESDIQYSVQRLNNIKQLKDNYNELVVAKVKEAHDVIQDEIMPNLLNISGMAKAPLDSLLSEIKQFNKSLLRDKEKVNAWIKENESRLIVKTIFNVGSILAVGVSILCGPAGIIAGGLALGAFNVGKMIIENDKKKAPKVKKLPAVIKQLDGDLEHFLAGENARLNKRLDRLLGFANKYPSQNVNGLSQKIVDIQKRVGQSKSLCEVKVLERESVDAVKAQYGELEEYYNSLFEEENNDKKQENNDEKIKSMVNGIGSIGADIVGDVLEYVDDLETARRLLSNISVKLKRLKKYEDMVYDLLCPLFDHLARTIADVSQNLENLSQVLLLVVDYKVKETLESMTVYVSKFAQEFTAQDMFSGIFKNIEGVFGILVGVYSQIKNYMDELNLANHMADLISAAASNIKVTGYYLKEVGELSITINSNLVLMYYQSAISAFKQFVFPFAHDYFQELILPKHLEVGKNLTDFVQKANYQILQLINKLVLYKSTVGNSNGWIHTARFNSFHNWTRPFFTWKNEQHREMISKLLSGEEVVVFADVEQSDSTKDAIKFSEIAVYLKTANQTDQDNINKCLETRKITLVHQGNSYYRYNSKVYLLTSTSLSISFSFDNEKGEPVDHSETYDKIKQGDYMLSPYTTWKLKISNMHKNTSFDDLKVFVNVADLELGGKGKYIDNTVEDKKDLKEDMYYKPLGI